MRGHEFCVEETGRFLMVAYRPNGTDTCRNCVMGSSDSDLKLVHFDTAADALEAIARLQAHKPALEACPWEIRLFVSGRKVARWYLDSCAEKREVPETLEEIERWEREEDWCAPGEFTEPDLPDDFAEELDASTRRKIEDRERAEELAREKEVFVRNQAVQERELAEFRRLQAKCEGSA